MIARMKFIFIMENYKNENTFQLYFATFASLFCFTCFIYSARISNSSETLQFQIIVMKVGLWASMHYFILLKYTLDHFRIHRWEHFSLGVLKINKISFQSGIENNTRYIHEKSCAWIYLRAQARMTKMVWGRRVLQLHATVLHWVFLIRRSALRRSMGQTIFLILAILSRRGIR